MNVVYCSKMVNRRTFTKLLGGTALVAPLRGVVASSLPPRQPGRIVFLPPTAQKILDGSVREGVFMDTGTGRPESGMFGNTRKYADGSPRFHEGIDIAPMPPWVRTRDPNDIVRAAADGLVVYVNHHDANPSLYGNYVVMTHEVPGFGPLYTLYAHLRAFNEGLRAGLELRAGLPLGLMGNVPDIPVARAHLHFEIGFIMNRFYPLIDPQHGIWNGANLYGIDPCDVFAEQARKGFFDPLDYLKRRKVAWSKILPAGPMPDFFKRYPSLWRGRFDAAQPRVICFSCEGVPIYGANVSGLNATLAAALVGSDAELKKGRNWANPKRGRTLLDNLLVSPTHLPEEVVKQGEVG